MIIAQSHRPSHSPLSNSQYSRMYEPVTMSKHRVFIMMSAKGKPRDDGSREMGGGRGEGRQKGDDPYSPTPTRGREASTRERVRQKSAHVRTLPSDGDFP